MPNPPDPPPSRARLIASLARAFAAGLGLRAYLWLAALTAPLALWLTLAEPEIWIELPRENGAREPVTAMDFGVAGAIAIGGQRNGTKVFDDSTGRVIAAFGGPGPALAVVRAGRTWTSPSAWLQPSAWAALYRSSSPNSENRYVARSVPSNAGVFETDLPVLVGGNQRSDYVVAKRRGETFDLYSFGGDTRLLVRCCGPVPPGGELTALARAKEAVIAGDRSGLYFVAADLTVAPRPVQQTPLATPLDRRLPGPVDLLAGALGADVVVAATRAGVIEFDGAPIEGVAQSLGISDDGQRLLVLFAGGELDLFAKAPGAGQAGLKGPPPASQRLAADAPRVLAAALSADGKTVAAAFADLSVRAFDVSDLFKPEGAAREIAVSRGHKDPVALISLSHDGSKVAAADVTGRVSITDISRAARLARFEAPFRALWRYSAGSDPRTANPSWTPFPRRVRTSEVKPAPVASPATPVQTKPPTPLNTPDAPSEPVKFDIPAAQLLEMLKIACLPGNSDLNVAAGQLADYFKKRNLAPTRPFIISKREYELLRGEKKKSPGC